METKYRIGWGMAAVLVFIAAFFDIVNAVPIVGSALAAIYWFAFGVYLWMTGHGIINPRRLVPGLLSMAIEVFPAIQSLPAIAAGTIAVILFSRFEDKTGIKRMSKEPKSRLPEKKAPLNQNGVRMPRNDETEENNLSA